jgi:phage protein D
MPDDSKDHVALYTILIDGGELAQEQRDRTKEIRVVNNLRLPDVCTVSVSYPKADGIDTHPFNIGSKLEIRLGAKEEQATETLFKGDIVTLEPSFGAGGVGLLVRAYDRAHLLHRSRKVRTFQNQTASDIVKTIAQQNGLQFQGESTSAVYEFMMQDNVTDWEFIWQLAERAGYEFLIEDATAKFRKPGSGPTVAVEWPKTLISFNPRVTAVQQVKSVSIATHDPKTKKVLENNTTWSDSMQVAQIGYKRPEVANKFAESKVHIATEPVKTAGEARAITEALMAKLANGYVAAEGTAFGNPKIKAGSMVQVTGIGQNFSGKYRIATATHVLRGGGSYMTTFANSPAHTILGVVGGSNGNGAGVDFASGLILGIVTNNNDPENMGRVRVMIPALGKDVQGKDAEGWWARIASVSAGKERGLMMLPVVGEEVLIGFEHGDITRPYVLGSLFNGKDLPGNDLLQEKNGSFALKSDEKIYQQSKKEFTIKSDDKLVIEITGNVEEKYKADWKNETTGKTSLKATQAFEAEGQSVSIKGQTGVTLESSATVTLKVGGSKVEVSQMGVTISGPMINIG